MVGLSHSLVGSDTNSRFIVPDGTELEDTQLVLEKWRMVWQLLVNSDHRHACRLTESCHDSSSR